MIAAGFFWMAGCTSESTAPPADGGRDGGFADTPPEAGPPPDTTRPADAGPGDTGPVDAGPPPTPPAPAASLVSDLPCAFPASLATNAANTSFFVACGGATNALFRSSPIGGAGPWSQVGIIGGYPSHHLPLTERFHAVGHSFPDGITIIDADTGAATDEVDLASLTLPGPDGEPLAFVPNSPAGMVLAGGSLCVATSDLDHIDADPALTTFHPGAVICMPWNGDGTLGVAEAQVLLTFGVNPTGMAQIDAAPRDDGTQRFAVLSSNGYADAPGAQAALEICEAPSMECTAVPLGNITAQISPQLHVTEDGVVLIGVQRPAPALIGVNAAIPDVVFTQPMPDVQNFIASIASLGGIVALSDFGVFGAGGSVLFLNVNPGGWAGVPVTALDGSAGPSAAVGGTLYQAVTSNDGTSGSLVQMSLAGLQ